MEHIQGETLDRYLEIHKEISADLIEDIMCQLSTIISILHKAKVCHRDIKPQNIIITSNNQLKLIDFNISKRWAEKDTSKCKSVFFTQISTPMFAAPEILKGEGYTQSVDIWGLGLIGYLLLGGMIQESVKLTVDSHSPKCAYFKDFVENSSIASDSLKAFIASCLEEDPSKRVTVEDPLFDSFIVEYNRQVEQATIYEEFEDEL